jgi:nucleoside-diphosphate-sugar epimerase
MTPGEQLRDFIFVDDAARGMVAVGESENTEGKSLDLGTGRGTRVLTVVERIWDLTEASGRIRAGALPYRSGAPMHLVADADRTAKLTGWQASTPLVEGLRVTLTHWTDKI